MLFPLIHRSYKQSMTLVIRYERRKDIINSFFFFFFLFKNMFLVTCMLYTTSNRIITERKYTKRGVLHCRKLNEKPSLVKCKNSIFLEKSALIVRRKWKKERNTRDNLHMCWSETLRSMFWNIYSCKLYISFIPRYFACK